ncbi:Eukaryotic translation initiation factor 3 subunit C like [Actinidia chinensis var. chinensis]|uniref:Eukaryotic translation initiation factor 3 subunit C like n=1 Tax=Actinidia chinensis var. chinensis TaxID=1590841 RepID=A0A2R6QEG5_ACTCC|nr:Eukaryotic translation initiation factor 3 subunit C like [Actinidia chinensis var. chinensis]
MACSMCFLRSPMQYVSALVPFLACFAFVGCGFWPLLFTASLAILSSIIFTFSKHKLEEDEKCSSEVETMVEQKGGCQISSLDDSFSESDQSIDESSVTDQDSEADWPYYSGNVGPSPDDSDGSISDEESLIEIALPSGHYVGPEKEEAKLSSQKEQKFQSPMEFLADINEVNEEDNLIEIDISMGSIKCSRFEIEA